MSVFIIVFKYSEDGFSFYDSCGPDSCSSLKASGWPLFSLTVTYYNNNIIAPLNNIMGNLQRKQ